MFNSHQSKMCASEARQQYTPMGHFFPFTPIKIKLYTMKVSMNIFFVLQVSVKIYLNMQISNIIIKYAQDTP